MRVGLFWGFILTTPPSLRIMIAISFVNDYCCVFRSWKGHASFEATTRAFKISRELQ